VSGLHQLIINADDFGFTAGINRGIRTAIAQGVVTSVSVMPNMPLAIEIKQIVEQFPQVSIGIHLNLTKGRPLLSPEQVSSLVDEEGYFLNRPAKLMAEANPEQLEKEIRAQFEQILGYGVRISHLDSHHHLHYHPEVLPLAVRMAKEYGVKAIRYPDQRFFTDNTDRISDFVWDYFYPQAVSVEEFQRFWQRGKELIREAGLKIPDHYLPDFFTKGKIGLRNLMEIAENLSEGISELFCHPGESDEDLENVSSYSKEREIELYTLTLPGLKEDLEQLGVQLVNYWAVGEQEDKKC
jgi:predicted glycoside hydrolase/deacetylase ChbG (UPF0249 family)